MGVTRGRAGRTLFFPSRAVRLSLLTLLLSLAACQSGSPEPTATSTATSTVPVAATPAAASPTSGATSATPAQAPGAGAGQAPAAAALPPTAAAAPAAAHVAGIVDHRVLDIAGQPKSLADYRGKVLLVVNVASRCGNTPQYASLQTLHTRYEAAGLEVLGFPSNDFGGQEPGTESEIQAFCSNEYGVTFDMFSKVTVVGPDKAPLYRTLTEESPADFRGEVRWNFAKFLVDREGRVIGRFAPNVDPLAPEVEAQVRQALGL